MSFPNSRPTSHISTSPVRFGPSSEHSHSMWGSSSHSSDPFFGRRLRRASTQSKTDTKGKQPVYGDEAGIRASSNTSRWTEVSLSRYAPTDSRPSTADGVKSHKPRTSLLVAASDALGFKFGRRRYHVRQPPMPLILPDVIEISAPRRDEDVEERDRLRDMAAQSIGIPVTMHPDIRSLDNSVAEDEEDDEEEDTSRNGVTSSLPNLDHRHFGDIRRDPPFSLPSKSLQGSSVSVPLPSSGFPSRLRSGSLLAHSRTNSVTLSPVPSFPTTHAALAQCKQSEAMLYKFYSPSSLRIFALHKNWRSRYMVLSSPTAVVRRNSSPPVSYLHLFKASNGEEKEIERLEINEESVVFVAEEDVGGRKHVVKVAGVDVGALRKELNHEEGGRTMWFLHISDAADAQKWITAIKNAILGQRTMRAGLGSPISPFGTIEPRGDMDVMLSIRAQGLITPPTNTINPRSAQINSQATIVHQDRSYASSTSSRRSQVTLHKYTSSGPVSALKGLFTGSTRPRSPSRATSIDSQRDGESMKDGSFGSMGNHLLSTGDGALGPTLATPNTIVPYDSDVPSAEYRLDRKIIPERAVLWTSPEPLIPTRERTHRTLSLQAVSLQPPPRKRWTSLRPGDHEAAILVDDDVNTMGNNVKRAATEAEVPLLMSGFCFGSHVHKSREPSIQSFSTLASGDNSSHADKSSVGTKRSSKRFSRQGLPRRLTPPSGPPPSIPNNQRSTSSAPTLLDRTPSEASSRRSTLSRQSVISSLPSFSKRTSGSSFLSMCPNPSPSSRPTSSHSHRTSMPPPRPAPTSALPPAPELEGRKTDQSTLPKSLRESVAQRAMRLSVIAPKPPPSTVLPPRPDGLGCGPVHRRSSSVGGHTPVSPLVPQTTPLHTPFPPPVGPLPLTPVTLQLDTSQSTQAVRRTSIKQRLRNLSAPSPSPASPPCSSPRRNVIGYPSPTSSTTAVSPATVSLPPTPIGEKIVDYENDLSFLQMTTPVIPYSPPPRLLLALPQPPEVGITPLSPPPRRNSKQISIVGIDPETTLTQDEKPMVELSRPGSVISLGIVNM